MSVTERWNLFGVSFGSTHVGGIRQQAARTDTTIRNEITDGLIYAKSQHLVSQAPTITFTGVDVAALLGTVTPNAGVSIAGLSGGFKMYLQSHADGGTRTSGSAHRSITATKGIIVPRRLTVEHQGDAQLECEVIPVYDGTNNPIVPAGSVSLPTIAAPARFTLGAWTLESVAITQIKRLEIDFGFEVETEGADSDIWATFASIRTYQPTISITTSKASLFAPSGAVDLDGLAGTHANTLGYLRKRAAGGTFVADETEEHISFTAAGVVHVQDLNVGSDGPGELMITMPTYYDGTNAPLVVDTTAAIA